MREARGCSGRSVGRRSPRFPAEIEGRAITEIGDYCFAAQAHLPAEYRVQLRAGGAGSRRCTGDSCGQGGRRDAGSGWRTGSRAGSRRCAGGTGRGVYNARDAAGGLKKIGNFAFYNATELAELELGSGIDTLGSDAFMNCRSLSRLLLHADPGQKTGLRLLLAQLSSV